MIARCSGCVVWGWTWDLAVILMGPSTEDFKTVYAKFLWHLTDMGTPARCPPLIHNQPTHTLLPQWFNSPICHHCCSHQNKRPDNDSFHPYTRHAVFHRWSKVLKMPHFWHFWSIYPLSSVTFFCCALLTLAANSCWDDEENNEGKQCLI